MKRNLQVDEISRLIRRGFHSVVFQPIRCLAHQTIYGYEALMRGPEGTVLENPATVFLNTQVDRTLLHQIDSACALSAISVGRLMRGMLFINVHGETLLRHAEGRADIMRMLSMVEVDPTRLVLEISETTDKTHARAIKRSLQPLRAAGVKIALDDVGVYNSWLHHMLTLDPEYVKVDRHFISNIDSSPSKIRVLRGFAAFGRETGAEIIVEGIETTAERAVVTDCGIDLGQGFLLGRPEPAHHWIEFLEAVPQQARVSAVFE